MPPLETPIPSLFLVAVAAYLVGAVPFGIVWARAFGLGDLRKIGSGNIGATNVLRTGNKPAAFLTLLCDSGKAAAAVLVARALLGNDAAQVAGFCAVLGHLFPVWLGFKGGKGVATMLGTLLALSFPVGLAASVTWLFVAFVVRFSSLAALAAAVLAPLYAVLFDYSYGAVLMGAIAVRVYIRHWPNIQRLMAGTEPQIGKGK